MNKLSKRLHRSRKRKLAGVCSGIADYLELDPVWIRLLWLLFTVLGGAGVFTYVIAWAIMPEAPPSAGEGESTVAAWR